MLRASSRIDEGVIEPDYRVLYVVGEGSDSTFAGTPLRRIFRPRDEAALTAACH
jgi:hypothetical protein